MPLLNILSIHNSHRSPSTLPPRYDLWSTRHPVRGTFPPAWWKSSSSLSKLKFFYARLLPIISEFVSGFLPGHALLNPFFATPHFLPVYTRSIHTQ